MKQCNLCGGKVQLKNPRDVYGPLYKHFKDKGPGKPVSFIYECQNCKARVGCHGDSKKPFGTLADAETRRARHLCHQLVDPLWKNKKDGNFNSGSTGKARTKIYKLIADHMGLTKDEMHFGLFTIEQCRVAYLFILKYKKKNNIS